MSHAAHRWKQYDTTLVVIFAVLIGAVLILTFVVVYETIVISRNACRDSKLRGTPYTGALGRALTNRCCWCYTKTEFADTVAVQTDSTLSAPFLLDVAVQGGEEGEYAEEPRKRWQWSQAGSDFSGATAE